MDSDDQMLVLALDALDEFNIYQLNLEFIQQLYEDRGDIYTAATLPHTAVSWPMMMGGIENEDKFWVEREDGLDGEDTGQYVDPAAYFDRQEGSPVEGARGFSRYEDYADETFVWDDLHNAGYDARALQVPIVLPPFSFRVTGELDDAWFPDTKHRMAEHIRKKPELIINELDDGADFLVSSIQMPDKWLHGIGEGKCSEEWVLNESPVFDSIIQALIEYCDENGVSWVVFGDHGSPHPGAMKKNGYILPRHRKESIIVSSKDLDPPTYTDELYEWMLDQYDAVPTRGPVIDDENTDMDADVESRLENLGYL